LQELDHVSIMKPITKFAATVPHTQRIPEIISMAFREAYNGRPGPSFLEIPRDVLDAKVDLDKVRFPEQYRSPYKVHGDPKAIELAATWFQQAERPAVLAGSQMQFCRGAEALAPFAIAAKTALPDKDIFVLFGDGAFGLTGFDIDTAGALWPAFRERGWQQCWLESDPLWPVVEIRPEAWRCGQQTQPHAL
jgi:thiamine pyrophosphate-dependent acetolactate synthase large subunit-like protein